MIRRCLLLLCVLGAAAMIGAAPASARLANGHLTGTLSVTADDTSLDSGGTQHAGHMTGHATLNDTYQRAGDGTYPQSDSSVLNMNASWSDTSPCCTDGGTASGTVTGFDQTTATGTVVNWGYDVTNPGQLAVGLDFHGTGTATDSLGICGGPATADLQLGIRFPMQNDGFGTVHIDKMLSPQNGGDTYADTGIASTSCGGFTTATVIHVVGDITVSPVSGGSGSGNAAGTATGSGSTRASSNGTATVGTSSCVGPNPCTDNTTVTNSGNGTHATKKVVYGRAKITVAAGKSVKLKVKLTKKALKALKKAGKLNTTVTVVITSQGAKKVTKTFKLTIKAPKK